jgi:hypothetical protein
MSVDAAAPRWRGQRGRLEVWYATFTDRGTGDGWWIHHERVAPTGGNVSSEAYSHGWVARFPAAGGSAVTRFGPDPAPLPGGGAMWLRGATVSTGPERLAGTAGEFGWDLVHTSSEPPIWTLPKAMWEREALPSAQVVAVPRATFRGVVTHADQEFDIDGLGNIAHIYGHGNAQRWAWLHADLDDDTTLEVVVAVSRRPAMRRIPPLSFVQLRRLSHDDWPRNPLLAAPLFRAHIGGPTWRVRGILGGRRLSITVTQPEDRCVRLDYTDPDGAGAVCTNSETADVDVRLESFRGTWRTEREWLLRGTAHAEYGTRT